MHTGNSAKQYYEYGGGVGMTDDKALLTHCIACSESPWGTRGFLLMVR